ncbi:MAG: hypothetical protein ACRDNY_01850 [Gaiellaceae bacterium]
MYESDDDLRRLQGVPWGKGVVVVVQPSSTWAYAFHPESVPG